MRARGGARGRERRDTLEDGKEEVECLLCVCYHPCCSTSLKFDQTFLSIMMIRLLLIIILLLLLLIIIMVAGTYYDHRWKY